MSKKNNGFWSSLFHRSGNSKKKESENVDLSSIRMAQETFNDKFDCLVQNTEVFAQMRKTVQQHSEQQTVTEQQINDYQNDMLSPEQKKIVEEIRNSTDFQAEFAETPDILSSNTVAEIAGQWKEIYSGLNNPENSIWILPDDIDKYIRYVSAIAGKFRDLSAAELVMTGADVMMENQLYVYIDQLQEALQSGKKMKANACFDIFKCVLTGKFGKVDSDGNICPSQKEFMELSEQLIREIDAYYEELQLLSVTYQEYSQAKNKYAEKVSAVQAIPEDIRKKLVDMDMKAAMQSPPDGDNIIRQYYPPIFDLKTMLMQFCMAEYEFRSLILNIMECRKTVKGLIAVIQKTFVPVPHE